MKRTHTCGQLRKQDVDKEATLIGWVYRRRDHGKLIFLDIRDREGWTQVVFHPKDFPEAHAQASKVRSEFLICVRGLVNARPKGMINPKIPTGEVELYAKEMQILNVSAGLPFEVDSETPVSEELRLKYRYLDLRRPEVLHVFKLRHRINHSIRCFLDESGFLEFETPILTKSTPEGARDYLVPSRLLPSKFFALPQSPQLFKQLLMVAGVERYFQIAKCFRDEDLRADRQPEFTQLDMEMSFLGQEDIFNICESLLQKIFKDCLNLELKIPFARISYKQAQDKYATDKPKIGEDKFNFIWVIDFPLFKYNEEEKRWESEHHPFTAPVEEDIQFLETEPKKVRAQSYDLVLNGAEIASGSIRIHKRQLQERIFKLIGISDKQAKERFGFLLEAFNFGAPAHAGIAFGLDRLIAIILGKDSIRDVIAFPKTQSGFCPLTGAPTDVDQRQLKELGIDLRNPQDKR
ncbi:MAG: aspartate--tRNA ligase [Candidatus Omnitrophica bacterium]|nr:aspartate--tRNA ligase [Candidatus Omnitrophota bacterium]